MENNTKTNKARRATRRKNQLLYVVRTTWAQIKRARVNGFGSMKGDKNPGVKSQAHLERIARRKIRRIERKHPTLALAV